MLLEQQILDPRAARPGAERRLFDPIFLAELAREGSPAAGDRAARLTRMHLDREASDGRTQDRMAAQRAHGAALDRPALMKREIFHFPIFPT